MLRSRSPAAQLLAAACLVLFALATTASASRHHPTRPAGIPDPMLYCATKEIPLGSGNVTDLNELTFWGKVADGRVWFVEFYADWCRGCKRIAGHVAMLADQLAAADPSIAVARVDCGQAERFCDQVIGITRTPSFKVYYQGRRALNYDAEFYFYDMMLGFITDTAANLRGFSLPSSQPQEAAEEYEGSDEEDDEYD